MKILSKSVTITVLLSLIVLTACNSMDSDLNSVEFYIDSANQSNISYSFSEDGMQTSLILAVPESITSITTTTYLIQNHDNQLEDLTDNTVTLTVPSDTRIRLIKIVFEDIWTLNEIHNNQPPAYSAGISDPFTIESGDSAKTVSIIMSDTFYSKTMTSFGFQAEDNDGLSVDIDGSISGTSITAIMPYATDLSSLIATYATDGYGVKIGDTIQTSGDTSNDFSGPVTYTVVAADGTEQDYTATVTSFSAAGILDTSFNTAGYITHSNAAGGNGDDVGRDIKIDSQGRIVVVGESDNDPSADVRERDMVIWRYNSDGTLDETFGTDGIVVHHDAAGGDGEDLGYALEFDTSDKIVVTGSSHSPGGTQHDFAVWRYTEDGDLDTSFSDDGVFTLDGLSGGTVVHEWSPQLTIDANGRILLVGSSASSSGYHMVVLRLTADGTADTSFDSDGIVTYRNAAGGDGPDYGFAIAIDNDDKIVVAGRSDNDPSADNKNFDLVVWRFNEDGSLDTSFNSGVGYSIHSNAAGGDDYDHPTAMVIDTDGKIVITGVSDSDPDDSVENKDMVIWRFNPDGSIDTSFGDNGVVIQSNVAGGDGGDSGGDIKIDAYGKYVISGSSVGTTTDMVIWRFNADGTLDTSFGSGGIVMFDNGYLDLGTSIAIDDNGKLLIAGRCNNSADADMAIWRYE